ncbi:MAG: putative toxin-antitoxin system toxin component, PIN family [Burkholderiaceae bacterium]|jgi:putative PIN family toxin of toxin-antitoxin system|nr:putative toxin-antitoxin system toxin component, PIN family [Burkholderiaceae bacterium]
MPDMTHAVVLDTNVVLDWLLFRDASCAGLSGPLCRGQLLWHATASMRGELASVVRRQELRRWAPDCEHILSTFDNLTKVCAEAPDVGCGMGRLRSRDPDDQKFIDLAVSVKATWLLSRDRALLRLARPARELGIQILTPARWQHAHGG